jgi:hypothetical protein
MRPKADIPNRQVHDRDAAKRGIQTAKKMATKHCL